jgi:hypothetical protein
VFWMARLFKHGSDDDIVDVFEAQSCILRRPRLLCQMFRMYASRDDHSQDRFHTWQSDNLGRPYITHVTSTLESSAGTVNLPDIRTGLRQLDSDRILQSFGEC